MRDLLCVGAEAVCSRNCGYLQVLFAEKKKKVYLRWRQVPAGIQALHHGARQGGAAGAVALRGPNG